MALVSRRRHVIAGLLLSPMNHVHRLGQCRINVTPEVVHAASTRKQSAIYRLKSMAKQLRSARVNTLPTANGSTAYARPTSSSDADSSWRRLCFGLDSPIPFFSFIANASTFRFTGSTEGLQWHRKLACSGGKRRPGGDLRI
ncbi:uncharacterized protein LOC122572704 [Bombus pyrosoma]|uniref:uncharacterized protein LOC122572704 n=1 Tax=Bombus pyrosoma TaxID=396416 RepID=UPI001CB8E7D7|nr:uncharacterized protein LOC122572704 [Bombus pyrosoma]